MTPAKRKQGKSKLVLNKESKKIEVVQPLYTFSGLWVTNQDRFVEVLSKTDAFILQEDGKRLARCLIDDNGKTEFVGSLMEKQRGQEEKTSTGLNWPILRRRD
jgi:hypothetical protein